MDILKEHKKALEELEKKFPKKELKPNFAGICQRQGRNFRVYKAKKPRLLKGKEKCPRPIGEKARRHVKGVLEAREEKAYKISKANERFGKGRLWKLMMAIWEGRVQVIYEHGKGTGIWNTPSPNQGKRIFLVDNVRFTEEDLKVLEDQCKEYVDGVLGKKLRSQRFPRLEKVVLSQSKKLPRPVKQLIKRKDRRIAWHQRVAKWYTDRRMKMDGERAEMRRSPIPDFFWRFRRTGERRFPSGLEELVKIELYSRRA